MAVVILGILVLVAAALVALSIHIKVAEIREDEAAWDALIARIRSGGAS